MGLASSGTSNETRDVTCSRLLLEHRLIVNSVVELTVALALEKDHSKQYLAGTTKAPVSLVLSLSY